MAISGFGDTNNLRLTKPLNLNQVNQQVQPQEEEAKKADPTKAEAASPKLPSGQVKFNQVDSLLVGRGIVINKPEQPQEPEQPSIKLNANHYFDSYDEFLKYKKEIGFKKGDKVHIHTGEYEYDIPKYDSYIIGKGGTMTPCATHIYDEGEYGELKKALEKGLFKEGDTIIVHNKDKMNVRYTYTGGKLVVDSIYEQRGG